jgi:HSP20 family protein
MVMRFERFPVLRPAFGSIFDLEKDIDSLFDSFLTRKPSPMVGRYPALDVVEYDNHSIIVAELPGVDKDQVKISLNKGVLTISGERKPTELPEQSKWLRNETEHGQFVRSVTLPHPVKAEDITADMKNGLLRITLPKAEEARPREISIK